MSASLSILIKDLATPRVKEILRLLTPAQRRAMLARLGKGLAVDLKAHFAQRETDSPNKQNFPRQHWWAREVRAKTALRSVTDDTAVVGVASPQFAFRVRGGTIKPGPGKRFLAIPTRPEVYGVRPSAKTIPGLFFARSGNRAWLATREGKALRVYWRLVRSVTQAADPRALPPIADLQAALEARAQQELARILKQHQA
jgi:hypothetical protein